MSVKITPTAFKIAIGANQKINFSMTNHNTTTTFTATTCSGGACTNYDYALWIFIPGSNPNLYQKGVAHFSVAPGNTYNLVVTFKAHSPLVAGKTYNGHLDVWDETGPATIWYFVQSPTFSVTVT